MHIDFDQSEHPHSCRNFAGGGYVMNLEGYEYETSKEFREFEFYSEGPKGRIRKIVRFALKVTDGVPYYNLSFGDWGNDEGRMDDISVSDNGDAEKILATVAIIVFRFLEDLPNALVYAKGSTPARTRLYQMRINKFWDEIEDLFHVFGLFDVNSWEIFEKNVNYKAFLMARK
jgi:hypothetical protein